jgi:hypothetical protein
MASVQSNGTPYKIKWRNPYRERPANTLTWWAIATPILVIAFCLLLGLAVLLPLVYIVLLSLLQCGIIASMPWSHEGTQASTEIETNNPHGWSGYPTKLDVGIYWYGKDNDPGPMFDPSAPNSNPHFDPSKPSVLFVHGYLRGSTGRGYRPSFNWSLNFDGCDYNAADGFIEGGYNIGVFYWNQICDDNTPLHAETKIHTSKNMRWLSRDLSGRLHYNQFEEGVGSVSEQLADLLKRSFPKGGESGTVGMQYRLVGHSLGAQLSVNATKLLLAEEEHAHLPTRISLCDAFYSNGKKGYLAAPNDTPAKLATANITEIKRRGVLFEAFEASFASVSPYDIASESARRALQPVVDFYTILNPVGLAPLQVIPRHVAAW